MGCLKMAKRLTQVVDRTLLIRREGLRRLSGGLYEIPMPVILRQPSESLIGIEKQVFAPLVLDSLNFDLPAEKPDNLKKLATHLATRAQRNERLVLDADSVG